MGGGAGAGGAVARARSWVCPDPGRNVLPAGRRRMTNEGKWGVSAETRVPD